MSEISSVGLDVLEKKLTTGNLSFSATSSEEGSIDNVVHIKQQDLGSAIESKPQTLDGYVRSHPLISGSTLKPNIQLYNETQNNIVESNMSFTDLENSLPTDRKESVCNETLYSTQQEIPEHTLPEIHIYSNDCKSIQKPEILDYSSMPENSNNHSTNRIHKKVDSTENSDQDVIIELPVIQTVYLQTDIYDESDKEQVKKEVMKVKVKPEKRFVDIIKEFPLYKIKIKEKKKYKVVPVYCPTIIEKVVEKVVYVPQVKYVECVKTVPIYKQVIKKVPYTVYKNIPKYNIINVPKVHKQIIENVVEIPGEVQYKNIIIENPIYVPNTKIVYVQKPKICIKVPVEGPTIDVTLPIDQNITQKIPKYQVNPPTMCVSKTSSLITTPITEIKPKISYSFPIDYNYVIKPTEHIHTIEVPQVTRKVVNIKKPIYVTAPKTIIQPKFYKKFVNLPSKSHQSDINDDVIIESVN